jgi:hypothetical protein
VLIRGRHRDVDQLRTQIRRQRDVVALHARPHHQARLQSQRGDGPDALALGLAHGRNADLQFGHAQSVEAARDVESFRRGLKATPADCSPSRRVVSLMPTW